VRCFTKGPKRLGRGRRGQSIVEFALISPIVSLLLTIAFQVALIGQSALALSQIASAAAHYAADNPAADQGAIADYVQSAASRTLESNEGHDLTVVVTPGGGSRSFGTPVTVSVSYNLKSRIVLPNPFLGVALPTSITCASTTFSE
jgi:Flp pilus assembly protein TadG